MSAPARRQSDLFAAVPASCPAGGPRPIRAVGQLRCSECGAEVRADWYEGDPEIMPAHGGCPARPAPRWTPAKPAEPVR